MGTTNEKDNQDNRSTIGGPADQEGTPANE
jgi:hypothetical protein